MTSATRANACLANMKWVTALLMVIGLAGLRPVLGQRLIKEYIWVNGKLVVIEVAGPPGAATLISPTGSISTSTPTYTWNAVTTSTWYYLWVNDSSGTPRITTWYTAGQTGCPTGTGNCTVTPDALSPGAYLWWIQTWNDAGDGSWSDAKSFVISCSSPGKATLVSPSGTISSTTPTYTWNAVSGAKPTWYYLWVNDGSGTPKIQQWYTAAQAGCPSGTGTCSVTPGTGLSAGPYQWWVETWSECGGLGPWSDGMSFTVAPEGGGEKAIGALPAADMPRLDSCAVSAFWRLTQYISEPLPAVFPKRSPLDLAEAAEVPMRHAREYLNRRQNVAVQARRGLKNPARDAPRSLADARGR